MSDQPQEQSDPNQLEQRITERALEATRNELSKTLSGWDARFEDAFKRSQTVLDKRISGQDAEYKTLLQQAQEKLDERISNLNDEFKGALQRAQVEAAAKVDARAGALVAKLTENDAAATEKLNAINTSKAAVEASLAEIKAHNTQSKTALDTTVQNQDTVVSIGKRAEQLNSDISSLQEQVVEAKESAAKFEITWQEKYEQQFKSIEDLLPGATGAGLASGFHDEKDAYEEKQKLAQRIFVGSLAVLVITLGFTPLQFFFGQASVDAPVNTFDFFQRMMWNLPIVAPAIWSAWHFNRQASLYDRLAEEYRHKEAISTAFQGYTKQLKNLDQIGALNEYLQNALREISVPPGHVYEKKMPAASPWEEQIGKVVEIAVEKGVKSGLLNNS